MWGLISRDSAAYDRDLDLGEGAVDEAHARTHRPRLPGERVAHGEEGLLARAAARVLVAAEVAEREVARAARGDDGPHLVLEELLRAARRGDRVPVGAAELRLRGGVRRVRGQLGLEAAYAEPEAVRVCAGPGGVSIRRQGWSSSSPDPAYYVVQ